MGNGSSSSRDAKGNIVLSITGSVNDYATKDMNPSLQVYKSEYDKLYSPAESLTSLSLNLPKFKTDTNNAASDFSSFNASTNTDCDNINTGYSKLNTDYSKLNTDYQSFKIGDYAPFKSAVDTNIANINTFLGK